MINYKDSSENTDHPDRYLDDSRNADSPITRLIGLLGRVFLLISGRRAFVLVYFYCYTISNTCF